MNDENPLGELASALPLSHNCLPEWRPWKGVLRGLRSESASSRSGRSAISYIKEAARELNMSVTSVRRLIDRGLLK